MGPQEPVVSVARRVLLALKAAEGPQVHPETGALTGPQGPTESRAPLVSQETQELLEIQVHPDSEETKARTGYQAPPERRASWELQDLDLADQKDPKGWLAVAETWAPRVPVGPLDPLDFRESLG